MKLQVNYNLIIIPIDINLSMGYFFFIKTVSVKYLNLYYYNE
jgi:hypothetical protein